jgi:hypothetical protein
MHEFADNGVQIVFLLVYIVNYESKRASKNIFLWTFVLRFQRFHRLFSVENHAFAFRIVKHKPKKSFWLSRIRANLGFPRAWTRKSRVRVEQRTSPKQV